MDKPVGRINASELRTTESFFMKEHGEADHETLVTYSVMLWFTPEFQATFSSDTEMETFIDLMFMETNQGYINSQIPVSY